MVALGYDPQTAGGLLVSIRPSARPRSRPSSSRASSSFVESAESRRAPASSSSEPVSRGMIHGRFQPFHNGHLEYLQGAAERSDVVFVGITNPDPKRIKPEALRPVAAPAESNPFSYVERLLMVKAAAADAGIAPERVT